MNPPFKPSEKMNFMNGILSKIKKLPFTIMDEVNLSELSELSLL